MLLSTYCGLLSRDNIMRMPADGRRMERDHDVDSSLFICCIVVIIIMSMVCRSKSEVAAVQPHIETLVSIPTYS
jgi:hypothetical protein